MGLNKRRLDKSRRASSSSSGGFFRFKEGRNIIRIFPFSHTVTELDYKKGFYKKSETEVGTKYDEIDREVFRHFTEEGVINCLLTDCKYCDEAAQYLESKKKSDLKIGNQLKARHTFYVNIVDINDVEAGIQIGNITSSVYNVVLGYICDPEFGEEILGAEGRDFVVDFDKSQDPSKMYVTKIRDAKRSEELDADLQDDITDLFRLAALEPGWSSNEDMKESEGTGEEDSEKIDRKKSSKKEKDDDENPFKDDEKSPESSDEQVDDTLPWEQDGMRIGSTVEFEDAGETLTGKVTDINTDTSEAAVKIGKDLYDIPLAELTVIKKDSKKSRKR